MLGGVTSVEDAGADEQDAIDIKAMHPAPTRNGGRRAACCADGGVERMSRRQ
jgi:hypothetical protein